MEMTIYIMHTISLLVYGWERQIVNLRICIIVKSWIYNGYTFWLPWNNGFWNTKIHPQGWNWFLQFLLATSKYFKMNRIENQFEFCNLLLYLLTLRGWETQTPLNAGNFMPWYYFLPAAKRQVKCWRGLLFFRRPLLKKGIDCFLVHCSFIIGVII